MNKFFKRLALLLAVLMIVSMMPVQLFATNGVITYVNNSTEDGEEQSNATEGETSENSNAPVMVNNVSYISLENALKNATPDANGVITYEIYGKTTIDSTGWVQVAKAGLTDLTKVEFVGKTSDAEICIAGEVAILADQEYDIDVSFESLTLSKLNPTYAKDYGHSTNYFTTWLRNTNATENTVTYTNCTFPNGLCNNQYGKTVVDGCTFSNATTGLYNFWNYGGNTEIKNSTFTGTRGIKTYNEGTLEVAPTVKIENTTFDGLTEKAAIVASKPVAVTVENVSVSGDNGFFTRDITGNDEVVLNVTGTGISGTFNITSDTNAEAAKEEFNITAGKFDAEVPSDYLADGVKQNEDGTVGDAPTYVATVNGKGYETLAEAIAAANDGDTIIVSAGEYTTYGNTSPKKSLTFVGAGAGNTIWTIGDLSKNVGGEGNGDYSFDGCDTITFKNMTLKSDGVDYRGFIRVSNTIVENCTLEGKTAYWGYETATFTGCTFNAPEGDYALWDYSTKTMTFDGCEFNISGKGVNVYVEAGNAGSEARKVEVKDCTINSTKANKAFLNIKNNTQAYEVTLSGDNKVNGLDADSSTGSDLYQVEATKVTETSGKTVKIQEKATDGTLTTVFEVKAASTAVAIVGGVEYATLEEAFAALNGTNHTLTLVDDSAWDAATPVYWQAGTQSGFSATLATALTAAYMADADDIIIVCRPDSDVGSMTHGHVADNLTIYGNNAYISDGECDLEVDTFMYSRETGQVAKTGVYLDKNITITAYELDNLGVWGQRNTNYTVNVNLNDCDGKAIEGKANVQRVYISGKSGVNNITVVGCDFLTKATAIYSNADGEIVIDNCSFTGSQAPVNLNHKANGTQTVTVKNSTFTDCGDNGDWKQFAAPVRFVNSGSGTMSTTVDNCEFTGTVGANGDILLGDGRNGQASNDVALTVTNTAATVVAQRPGYYNGTATDTTKAASKEVTSSETFVTSIDDMVVLEVVDLDTFLKMLAKANYNFDGTLKNGGKLTVKWSPVTGCYDTRAGHTCTVNGVTATGNTPKRVNNGLTQFQLFEGSDVAVTIKNVKFVYEPADFTVCENSGWAGSFTAKQAPAGQLYFMTTGDITVDSCDFEKVVFTTFNTTGTTTVKDCTFKDVYNNYAIKDIRGENVSVTGTTIENCGGGIMVSSTGKVSNVTITGNTFKDVDVAGTAPDGKVGTRAILQVASSGDYKSTDFDFSGNTADNCGPVIRQLNETVTPVGSSLKYLTEGTNTASGLYTSDSKATGYGYIEDENGNVTITDKDGLFWFAKQVNSGNNFAGKTVKLANDIDLNNELWTPIGIYGDNKTWFKGTFDGQNHTVSGLKVVEYSKNGVGFFGKVYTGTIKNLTVEGNITAYGCNYVGGIVGHGYATITNCTFRGNVGDKTTMQVGGIAGSGGFTVTNCSVYGNVSAACWAGGIVGNCQDGGAYLNCYVEGEISAESIYWGGGAAGITPVPLYPSQVISGCYSNTVVKVAGEEVNCPIIAAYNNPLDYNGYTGDLKIYDNSWNKQKNSNDSYPIYAEKNGVGGVLVEGKTVSRDNNLIMLEDDLKYVEGDLSAVRIMAGSSVTQEQVDALAVAQLGDRKYTSIETAIAAANDGETVKLLADVTADVAINKNITLDLGGKTLTNTNSGKATITISAGTTATVKNGNVVGGTSYYAIQNNGTATLTDITVTGNNVASLIDNYGTMTIKSGTYTGGLDTVKNEPNAVLDISGGTFTLTKGTSKGFTGVVFNYGTLTISGGEFIQSDKSAPYGQAQVIHTDKSGSATSSTIITGGTFKNLCTRSTAWTVRATNAAAGATKVSGGTFNKKVSESYCADRYIPTQNEDGTYGVQEAMKGSKKNPYTLAELSVMTRDEYITAQKALGGTMYVEVGNYSYDKNGVLGNGKRDDTLHQTEDRSVLNGYNSNGYLGEKNDGANGKNIIFVGGSITSGVTGYKDIDNIGTSLLLAVPAYTNVTFEGVTFNNVMSFDYQLYTGPWSQLGELKFDNCKFNGLIVGAIATQTLTFDGCEFTAYTNTVDANNSNPTWIRPAYGNWSKGDNEGQGDDFKSLTTIKFTNNKVTSTRPVKFERIAQWEMDTKVAVTDNQFDIKPDGSSKNVGIYFGANAKFDLTVDNNKKSDETAGLYTGVYNAPNGKNYAGLPAGSTVKDKAGNDVEVAGVIWKTTTNITLKTTTEAVEVGGVKFATLEEAYAAATNGATITLLEDCKSGRINLEDKSITVVFNGKTLTSTAAYGVMFCAKNGNKITIDGTVEGSKLVGTLMITSGTYGHIEVNGGTYESSQYCPIYVNGAVSNENSTVTVKNATITAIGENSDQDMGCGVYLAGYSTSVFENCTITAPVTGIEIRAGKLTLNNCNVTGGNGEVKAIANGNGTTVTNAALAISQHNTKKPIEVAINGGTFNGTAAVYQTDVQGTGSADVKIAVNDGIFNGTISGETDGTIVISGGKFKVKVDGKYFKDGLACSGKPGADGYYTVTGHPITNVGLTLGEDISIRIIIGSEYKDGKIKVTYETYDPNTKGMVTKELILDKYELAWDDDKNDVKYQFRIRNITPQMADVVFTLQYLDSEGNKIGSAKQISIVEYCRKFAETSAFEAYKAKIGQLLNYCATAMDLRAKTHGNDVYNGLSWEQRATALRAKISEFGYTVADFDFGNVGQYSNIIIEKIVTSFGIEFAESVKLYYFIPLDNYKDGYTYVADGLLTPVPVYKDGVLTGYRVYLKVAMDGYHTMRILYVYDANGNEVQKIGMAPDFALKYLYNSDKQTNEFKQLCKAAYQYFIAFAE